MRKVECVQGAGREQTGRGGEMKKLKEFSGKGGGNLEKVGI